MSLMSKVAIFMRYLGGTTRLLSHSITPRSWMTSRKSLSGDELRRSAGKAGTFEARPGSICHPAFNMGQSICPIH